MNIYQEVHRQCVRRKIKDQMKESVRLIESLNGQLDATCPDEQEVHFKLIEACGETFKGSQRQ
jgi:hypothetical protein